MFGSSPCCFLARFQILAQILQLKLLCPCCVMLFEVQLVRAPAVCSRNALWNINFESEPGSTDPKIFQLMHCCTMLYHTTPCCTYNFTFISVWGTTLASTEESGKTISTSHHRRTDLGDLGPQSPWHSWCLDSQDWRALSIYQLITDRFADGDPRNNELFAGGFDVRDMTYRREDGTHYEDGTQYDKGTVWFWVQSFSPIWTFQNATPALAQPRQT